MKKRVLCLTLGLILAFSQVVTVSASSRKQQLQQEKEATQNKLSAQESKIDALEEQKAALAAEINKLDADLVNVLVEIDILEGELTAKEEEIVKTKEDLAVAEQDRDAQYAAMKKRIQYLYEKGGNDAWAQMLLQAESLASLLNQAEYVQQLYESDRKSLESFKTVVQEVTDLGNQLETEKADLEVMQTEYEIRQADLETQLSEKKAASSDYANQIAKAESQAAAYAAAIREQNAEIRKIEEEERKAAEEAARKEAERKEAERKAAEEAARKEAERKEAERKEAERREEEEKKQSSKPEAKPPANNNNNNAANDDKTPEKPGSGNDGGSKEESSDVPYNPTGSSVVNYACQFVGNPYVYGGNSLTNGTDCSGFIKLVYANFGVSLPRSSGAYLGVGRSVPYSKAMPGDIICYAGHVAIYMGGGQIVHASNSAPYPQGGIKISPNAAYRQILSVRRVL